MAVPRFLSDLVGTALNRFQIGLGTAGALLKTTAGALAVRNTADTADADFTAAKLSASGDSLELNSDAAGTGTDHILTLSRAPTGMTAPLTLVLPPADGSPNHVLTTDGAGNLSFAAQASGNTNSENVDTTALAFGDSSPATLFTKPANSYIPIIEIVIDAQFNGTPSLSIGITGQTSKYLSTTQVDLTAAAGTVFEVNPGLAAEVGTEALIATYSAGAATAGSARIMVHYAAPT